MAEPTASPLFIPDYGVEEHHERVLPWSHVVDRMREAQNYWIATTRPDGRPHAVAVWGVWAHDTVCFGGGPRTVWMRNLRARPEVVVHLEDGTQVVVIEGSAEPITDAADPRLGPIDDEYEKKYKMRHGPTIWVVKPRLAYAWTEFPKDVTRWRFE